MDTLGKRIISVRCDKNRDDFAALYGVHRHTLAKWEAGSILPSEAILYKMAKDHCVPLEWLQNGFSEGKENRPSAPADSEKNATVAGHKIDNLLKNKDIHNSKPATVAGSEFLKEINTLNKELRDAMRQTGDLLRENGDLRVQVSEMKAQIREMERSLREGAAKEPGRDEALGILEAENKQLRGLVKRFERMGLSLSAETDTCQRAVPGQK